MILSWLSERELHVGDQRIRKSITWGVHQGSVPGPYLWNIVYDYLLDIVVPPGVHLIGFADDF